MEKNLQLKLRYLIELGAQQWSEIFSRHKNSRAEHVNRVNIQEREQRQGSPCRREWKKRARRLCFLVYNNVWGRGTCTASWKQLSDNQLVKCWWGSVRYSMWYTCRVCHCASANKGKCDVRRIKGSKVQYNLWQWSHVKDRQGAWMSYITFFVSCCGHTSCSASSFKSEKR